MMSVESNEQTNGEVQNENDTSTSEEIQTKYDPNLNLSTIPKVDKSLISSLFTNNIEYNPLYKVKSIVKTLIIGDVGDIEFQTKIENNVYGVTLIPYQTESDFRKLVLVLPPVCSRLLKLFKYRPSLRYMVCGRRPDGDWVRGYIVSQQPTTKLAAIDEARIVPINKIAPCHKSFSCMRAFGAICEIVDPTHKFELGELWDFEALGPLIHNEQGEYGIHILRGGIKIEAIVKPWLPTPEQKGLQYAELKNESEVRLTAYRSHFVLFVRSLDTASLENYNHIMQTVAECAQTSPFLKELPVVGQMVIAQFTDENYYRAIVTKIKNDKITVLYADLGNTEVTDIKKLKILPDNLKELRSCTTKVVLKDIPKGVRMTREVDDYLAHVVGFGAPLLCTFDGIPIKDGVYLKFRDGEDINKMVNKLLKPISEEATE